MKAEKLDPSNIYSQFHEAYWNKGCSALLSAHEGYSVLDVSILGLRVEHILIRPEYGKIWDDANAFCNGASVFINPPDPSAPDDKDEANPTDDVKSNYGHKEEHRVHGVIFISDGHTAVSNSSEFAFGKYLYPGDNKAKSTEVQCA